MVATSATRDAANAQEFTDRVLEILGVAPEVITGDEEAWLSFTGATRELAGTPLAADACRRTWSPTSAAAPPSSSSAGPTREERAGSRGQQRPLGEHRLRPADRAAPARRPAARQRRSRPRSRTSTPRSSQAAAAVPAEKARTLVGLAGSVTTVAAIALGLDEYDSARIHHSRISAARVHEISWRPARDDASRTGGDPGHAPGPGGRDRRGRAHPRPDHDPVRLRRSPRQRARHPRRHRLVADPVHPAGLSLLAPDGQATRRRRRRRWRAARPRSARSPPARLTCRSSPPGSRSAVPAPAGQLAGGGRGHPPQVLPR